MLDVGYIAGHNEALRALGLEKTAFLGMGRRVAQEASTGAGDLVQQLAQAEGRATAQGAATGAGKGLLQRVTSKITPGRAAGVGLLTGGALLANHMLSGDQPQVAVTPSSTIAPLFP